MKTLYLESSIRVASKVFDAINDYYSFDDKIECFAPCLWQGVFSDEDVDENEDVAEEFAADLDYHMRLAGIPADEYEISIC